MARTPLQARQLAATPANNLIINGNFDVWQRGTTLTGLAATSTTYLTDRFKLTVSNTGAVYRMDRSTDVPTFAQSGFNSVYSLAVQCTTLDATVDAADQVLLRHSIEGYNYEEVHNGKFIRVSFWVKSVLTGTYCLELRNDANNRCYIKEYTITQANTWEEKVITLATDTTGTWDLINGVGLSVCWTLVVGSTFQTAANAWTAGSFRGTSNQVNFSSSTSNIFKIAQVSITPAVSLDVLSTPQTFRRAGGNIEQEISMCQRYYEKSYDLDIAPGSNSAAAGLILQTISTNGSGFVNTWVPFKVRKRAVGTATGYRFNPGTSGQWDMNRSGSSANIVVVATVGTSSCYFTSNNTGASWVACEVLGHWVVDAEI